MFRSGRALDKPLIISQLLDPFGETAWIRHAAGAARLIQLRGTNSYTSDFEKALFVAHTGPIVYSHLAEWIEGSAANVTR